MTDPVSVALIAAVGGIIVAVVQKGRRDTKKELAVIHVLVNSRLTEALQEITDLRSYIDSKVALKPGETSEAAVPQNPRGS